MLPFPGFAICCISAFKASVLGGINNHNPQGCTKDQLGQSSAIYFAYKTPSMRLTHSGFAGCSGAPLSSMGHRHFSQQQGQIASIPGLGELPPLLATRQTQCSGQSWEPSMTKSSFVSFGTSAPCHKIHILCSQGSPGARGTRYRRSVAPWRAATCH